MANLQKSVPVKQDTSLKFTEADIRKMRDLVFGIPSSDKNWAGCREFWMQPSEMAWLKKWCEDHHLK